MWISIELLSPTTPGVPQPGLDVDTDVEHDALGLPFLRGSAIRGLFREAWADMEEAMPVELREAAVRVLGRSSSNDDDARWHFGSASLPDIASQWIRWATQRRTSPLSPQAILESLTERVDQTALTRAGAPLEHTLRVRRVLLPGLVLTLPVTPLWDVRPDDHRHDLQCLARMALHVRNIGVRRTRGWGHVALGLAPADPGTDLPAWAEHARECALRLAWDEPRPEDMGHAWDTARSPAQDMDQPEPGDGEMFLALELRLTEPLAVTAPGSDPNGSDSLDYIPGRMIQAALIERAARAGRSDLVEACLTGRITALAARPVVGGARAMALPLSWRIRKSGATTSSSGVLHYDLLDGPPEEDTDDRELPLESFVQSRYGYFHENRGTTVHMTGPRERVQRDPERGAAWSDRGAVYSIDAIAPGQTLIGALRVERGATQYVAAVRAMLENRPLAMGRQRRAGFGGRMTAVVGADTALEPGVPDPASTLRGVSLFDVVLTAPAICVDPETGQDDPAALTEDVRRLLDDRGVKIVGAAMEPVVIRGYNRHGGVSAPDALASAAGSVVRVRVDEPLDVGAMEELARSTVGTRRSEGFGTIALSPVIGAREVREDSQDVVRPNGAVPNVVAAIEREIVFAAADRQLPLVAAAADVRSPPPPSFTARLRHAVNATGMAGLSSELRESRQRTTAAGHLDRCHVDGVPLGDWLDEDHSAGVPTATARRICAELYLSDESAASELFDEWRKERRERYVDLVLARIQDLGRRRS